MFPLCIQCWKCITYYFLGAHAQQTLEVTNIETVTDLGDLCYHSECFTLCNGHELMRQEVEVYSSWVICLGFKLLRGKVMLVSIVNLAEFKSQPSEKILGLPVRCYLYQGQLWVRGFLLGVVLIAFIDLRRPILTMSRIISQVGSLECIKWGKRSKHQCIHCSVLLVMDSVC